MTTSSHTVKARLSAAAAFAAQGCGIATALANAAPNSIDRIMLQLAASMCQGAERQLAAAWEIIQDIAAEPLDPDQEETP